MQEEKRNPKLIDYKGKIKKHRRNHMMIILGAAAIVLLVAIIAFFQYRRRIYTQYEVMNAVPRMKSEQATDMRLGNAVLTYSRDGVYCTDSKGSVTWNQTFEMQDILMDTCRDTVAVGNYNGRDVLVQNTAKQLGAFQTTLPIKNLTVSQSGLVTVLMEDGDITWINTYDALGNIIYEGQTHMHNSGYPCAISLSPSGELLAVSYLYIEAGELKTNVAFYNFGSVGDNKSDHLVSAFSYSNLLVPELHFMDNSTAFAVGDSRLMFFKGDKVPVSQMEHLFENEVLSVFYNEKYVGLVYASDEMDKKYMIDIYNASTQKVGRFYFDIDYQDIFFEKDCFVIYNSTQCMVMTMNGTEKYEGTFEKNINLMQPTTIPYRYMIMTDSAIETIQLK